MELAKLMPKGQITIPMRIQKKLNLKEGDKIMFIERSNAIQIVNSSIAAIEKLQAAMDGEAEKAGIFDEDDVMALCDDVRKELYRKLTAQVLKDYRYSEPMKISHKDFLSNSRFSEELSQELSTG